MIEAPAVAIAPPAPATIDVRPVPVVRACIVRLAGTRLALDVRCAREVAVFDEIAAVPRAPAPVRGVANLRGTILPLVDIGPLLGLAAALSVRDVTALVIQDGLVRVGVIVDAAEGLESFSRILPAPSGLRPGQGLVRGLLSWRDELIPLLDSGPILEALALEMGRVVPAPLPTLNGHAGRSREAYR